MQKMDELENNLINKNLEIKTTKILEIGETKKKKIKIIFNDFDESDPIEHINSRIDEFKETVKNKSINIKKDSKLSHLFGIKLEQTETKDSSLMDASIIDSLSSKKSSILSIKEPLEKHQSQELIFKESDFIGLSHAPLIRSNSENSTKKNISKMKSIYDNSNINTNLIEKIQIPLNNQDKKSSLIEDLFGSGPKSSSVIDKNSKKATFNFETSTTHSNPRESLIGLSNESINKISNESGFSLSASKESRRGRRASTLQTSDPLGFFSASTSQSYETFKIEEKVIPPPIDENISKSMAVEELPEWLGGPKVLKEFKQEMEKTAKNEIPSSLNSNETLNKNSTDFQNAILGNENKDHTAFTSKLLSIEFDQQAAIMNMQQQEHELRTVAALSQQNKKLDYLLESQKIKLNEQEKQFNILISRQLERQNIIEAQMKFQQDRIDSYIQSLTAQTTIIPSMNLMTSKNIKLNCKEEVDEKENTQNFLQKLELEKLSLESTLNNLREKHEKEMLILEDSYKKQVTFLEEAMVQMEKRMQDEVECLEADYKHKIHKLKEEILELEKIHKSEKKILKEENCTLIQEISNNHLKNLNIMQKEHIEIIEKITQSKESERKAIEIINIDGINVENILNKSQLIIESLEILQKKIENKDNNFTESHNHHLLVQEKHIEYLKKLLEKQKDVFIEEKQNLMKMVQKLELNSSELIKEFRIQNKVFKENQEIVKSKEQALLKDREIFTEQTKWERERLQTIRDESAKEQDKQLEWLIQERQTLIAEKGKQQIFNRLKFGADDSLKIELEATIKAAQYAAENANQERLRWQEKINDLEIQQNMLQKKENHLIKKAKELQVFTQSAIAKKEEGLRALKEAHFIEQRFQEKMKQMQSLQDSLKQKENKLATEKLQLARQRLSFHVSHDIDTPVKDSMNKVDIKFNHEDPFSILEVPSSNKNITFFKDNIDPHLVMLKWELDNDKLETSKKFPFIASH